MKNKKTKSAKTIKYEICLGKIGSASKFVTVMNRIKGCAMLISPAYRINAKSLLGTMNMANKLKNKPVTLEITLRDESDAEGALSCIEGFDDLMASCAVNNIRTEDNACHA